MISTNWKRNRWNPLHSKTRAFQHACEHGSGGGPAGAVAPGRAPLSSPGQTLSGCCPQCAAQLPGLPVPATRCRQTLRWLGPATCTGQAADKRLKKLLVAGRGSGSGGATGGGTLLPSARKGMPSGEEQEQETCADCPKSAGARHPPFAKELPSPVAVASIAGR